MEAVMRGGLAEESVSMVLEEPKAVDQLVGEAERDDFVVLLVDEPTKIWETLTNIPGMRSVV